MTRETLKEEGCLAYCLSPVGLKQDLDGRWSEKMQKLQWKQAPAALELIDYGSEGGTTVNK